MKPRLLDLFCGAGGAGMGYSRAGFDVFGVDIEPQPNYPFEFKQADAMTYPLADFDAIHASPPCQAFTQAREQHHIGIRSFQKRWDVDLKAEAEALDAEYAGGSSTPHT